MTTNERLFNQGFQAGRWSGCFKHFTPEPWRMRQVEWARGFTAGRRAGLPGSAE